MHDKAFVPPMQDEAGYMPLSATPGQACANCRWFSASEWEESGFEYEPRCNLIVNYPEQILPTGHCQRWEAVPDRSISQEPMPVVIVQPEQQGEAALGKQQRGLMERLLALLPKRKEAEAVGIKVAGNDWLITWSNNFEDRDEEIFTSKAIDEYVSRVDMGFVPTPEVWVWHAGAKTRIGKAAWVGRHEHFLIAAGTFDDAPHAQNAKAYYKKNAHKTGVSHGFTFPADKFDGKHYHSFNTFEISLLPRGKEANRYTSLEGVKSMALTDDKRKHIEEVFGKEEAASILSDLEAKGKALEEVGVAYKEFVATDEQPSAAKAAVEQVETDLKALIADVIGDNAETVVQQAAAAKAYTALDGRLKALEETVTALKEVFDLKPRTASQDTETKITNEEVVKEVERQFAKKDSFWGTEVHEG